MLIYENEANNCKLKKNTQLKLLEYFALEVTARSAANLIDIHTDSFPLFLKEWEFIFNYGTPRQQFETLRLWCDI
ncbi:hypothetical protein MCP_0987 [Methanocella paludicola SANAE]|uniref:Transposase n=1 Tax=Methanocella paludicola (strain DSM 17711 / JCM 13418 / NBRC 101707 / SANAE) TaxID=304371 RepID=D1YX87_METPS|nr:hypothetical protein MCP_0987 [Methanocella paludicola SANAE]